MKLESRRTSQSRFVRLGLFILLLTLTSLVSSTSASWSHGFLTNPVSLKVSGHQVVGTAMVPRNELAIDSSGVSSSILVSARTHIALRVNGMQLSIKSAWIDSAKIQKDSDIVPLTFITEEFGGAADSIQLSWNFDAPNKQIVLQSGRSTILATLNENNSVTFNISLGSSVASFFSQGMNHIALGMDHLLFLVVLALGLFKTSVSRKSVARAFGLVGAFTLGHAISFTLAYFGLVAMAANLVEPVIAFSICLTAIAALTKWEWEKFWIIATLIGLIHGLGFASSLAQLGIATSEDAAAIISFNLGVELAQTLVVSATAVLLLLARRFLPASHEIMRRAVLVAIGIVGAFWAITRL